MPYFRLPHKTWEWQNAYLFGVKTHHLKGHVSIFSVTVRQTFKCGIVLIRPFISVTEREQGFSAM